LYQGFEKDSLPGFCKSKNITIHFLYPIGTYLIEGTPLLQIITDKKSLSKDFEEELIPLVNIDRGQEIKTSYYYGFGQLMEIAIKALSPGINDPGTAAISLRALGDLLAFRLWHFPKEKYYDKDGIVRVTTKEKSFVELFEEYLLPIWDYGKNDRLIQNEMGNVLKQLKQKGNQTSVQKLLEAVHELKNKRSI